MLMPMRPAIVLFLVAAGAVAAPSCASPTEPPNESGSSVDTQTEAGAGSGGAAGSGGVDGGESVEVLPPTAPFRFPNTPVGRALSSYILLRMRSDPESVALRSSTHAFLRANAREAADVMLAVYDQLPEEDYLVRWHAVHALSSLVAPEAVGALRSILQRDVPPERWGGGQTERLSVSEEVVLRRRAIEGLKPLALAGSVEAATALRQGLSSPIPSLRSASARAYLAVGRKSSARIAEVRSMLPESERAVVDRRPATPEDFDASPPAPPPADAPPSPVAPARTP